MKAQIIFWPFSLQWEVWNNSMFFCHSYKGKQLWKFLFVSLDDEILFKRGLKERICSKGSKFFPEELIPIDKAGKNENELLPKRCTWSPYLSKSKTCLNITQQIHTAVHTCIVLVSSCNPHLSSSCLASSFWFTALINFIIVSFRCSGVTLVCMAKSYNRKINWCLDDNADIIWAVTRQNLHIWHICQTNAQTRDVFA